MVSGACRASAILLPLLSQRKGESTFGMLTAQYNSVHRVHGFFELRAWCGSNQRTDYGVLLTP